MDSKTASSEVTLVDRIRVVYFLEDRAQEGLIKAIVQRVAQEEGLVSIHLAHDIRSARYGSKVIREFKRFLNDLRKSQEFTPDLFVVVIDGNCKGYNQRLEQLKKFIKPTDSFRDRIVYAVPDPHIERWYLMDQRALKEATGLPQAPAMPPYKCKKDHYKQVLRNALSQPPLRSLLGGVEFAEKIVDHMVNLETLGLQNAGFERLISDLRASFHRMSQRR